MKAQTAQNLLSNSGAVTINEITLPHGIVFKNKDLLANINCWHKFVVSNADNCNRNEVLGPILDQVHPLDLIPVSFWKDKHGACFLARNCGPAIQKLCKDNLVVPSKNARPFKLTIILKFATTSEFKIDVQKKILQVLSKRYDTVTKTLNLVRFYEDPDLTEFCPLSQPKIMFFVLHLSKSLAPPPANYLLMSNKIKLLHPLEALATTATQVKSLDLRNNLLENFDTMHHLKLFSLTKLYLDGNPLCQNVTTEEYVNQIRRKIKKLEVLDDIPLKSGAFPTPRKLYLCDLNGADLVNQFLEQYFFIYDSQNRKLIQELYHKNALFSLNSIYHNAQLSSASTRLYKYNNLSRNLHKLADFSQTLKNLYRGNREIVNMLCSLPATEHDPYSFVVDLIYYTSRCAIIGVSGTFRERPESLLDTEKIYGFRRIFTIETVNGDGLSYITNEEFHVHNGLSWQVIDGFRVSKPINSTPNRSIPQSDKDCQKLIETLQTITTLNSEWAKKCLEECNYDLKKALMLFVDLYKQNRIPDEGFEETNTV